jgi:hypothetical protein
MLKRYLADEQACQGVSVAMAFFVVGVLWFVRFPVRFVSCDLYGALCSCVIVFVCLLVGVPYGFLRCQVKFALCTVPI